MIRRPLSALAVLLAFLAALTWVVDRNVGSDEGFARTGVATLRSEAGVRLVTGHVTDAVRATARRNGVPLPAGAVNATLPGVVRRAVESPAFAAAADAELRRMHGDLVAGRSDVTFRLRVLRGVVAAAADRVSPGLSRFLPPPDRWGVLRLDTGDRVSGAATIGAVLRVLHRAPPLLLLGAVVLGAVGMTGGRLMGGRAVLGVGLVGAGAALWVVGRLLPGAASAVVRPAQPAGELARIAVTHALDGTTVAAVVLAACGAAALLLPKP